MTPVRVDRLQVDDAQRTYILLTGRKVNERGEDDGAHVNTGLVGAFVLQDHAGQRQLLAGHATLRVGTMGNAPAEWQWVKLGPDNYWGWTATWGDCHQGYCGVRQSIVAPYGKSMRELAGFAIGQDTSGSCADKACERRAAVLKANLEIDAAQIDQRVFPLRVTVEGRKDGRALKPFSWLLPFDAQAWRYREPKDWPLKDADF